MTAENKDMIPVRTELVDASGHDSDDDGASVDWDTATEHFSNSRDSESSVKPMIGAAENQRVFYSRILVGLVLVVSAAATAGLTYALTAQEEQNTFERDFAGIAKEIVEVAQTAENNLVKIMFDFSTMLTSAALGLKQVWPNVTIPDFERRASASMDVSGGKFLGVMMAVEPTNASRAAWNQYADENIGWLNESHAILGTKPAPVLSEMYSLNPKWEGDNDTVNPVAIPSFGNQLHLVTWQVSPPPLDSPLLIRGDYKHYYTPRWDYVNETGRTARSPIVTVNGWLLNLPIYDPVNIYYQPVYDTFDDDNKTLVAIAYMVLRWMDHFQDLLHDDAVGIMIVLNSTCGDLVTYEVNGHNATYLGQGDQHDTQFDYLGESAGLTLAMNEILQGSTYSEKGISCGYSISVYPSERLRDKYTTGRPWAYSLIVLAIFAFTSLVFVLYDCLVQRRQETVMDSAVKTDAIVSQLFPEQFREQMLANAEAEKQMEKNKNNRSDTFRSMSAKSSLHAFMGGDDAMETEMEDEDLFVSKPVADLFPNVTVLFADIVGFTAWSSVREPSQVFTLLETIYRSFDKVAKRRKIYKVETVGDSYVAVAGVPFPMANHAVTMARFARECSMKLPEVVHRLETHLGPGTGDIQMRFGIHSGPVTAGVLRGEKARFQLFGDTVNTASRIENSGVGNRVHLSENTANLIIAAGRSSWVAPRPDPVHLKGIGSVKTFWLVASKAGSRAGSVFDRSETFETPNAKDLGRAAIRGSIHSGIVSGWKDQTKRLVAWNTESLLRLLQKVAASRGGAPKSNHTEGARKLMPTAAPLSEVVEIIPLPGFDSKQVCKKQVNPESIDLGPEVRRQLSSYVSWVASSYKNNPFHNFEHASHVSMSVNKLLSRIVAPDISVEDADETKMKAKMAAELHDHTYGITSDPLTQFACALAALIHDVDHRGVPNGRLVEEEPRLGELYEQSVAEQNSVDLAWLKLMSDEYQDLRACIYSNEAEMKRFRQVVVNTVLATDIFDKKLKALRNARWDKAFHNADKFIDEGTGIISEQEDVNRKATIVIEHIIQASDVSHTMQHWHVYTKWNEKLYQEQYLAYVAGRGGAKDPTDGWYGGELWFFDNYVIPLSKKLAECGVFGVSSDEYLNYALENRKEWAQKGRDIVDAMAKKYRREAALPEQAVAVDDSTLTRVCE
ncbi:Receptor-type guanylate cyclase gcy [Seminavis robusta]|uniref:Receptor-type guanylate cyclase gcy n=1 Tax=Seminavis robusta TaxID=568900 RepID=A0A9N8DG55_9STRA|nr:Receptor-type guanylate cyclase gcy [Seminavis robusta]|eukprot:Sro76_g041670.1 Receptor-type guanylate cyclase gcy (1182) ;mRNA; f:69670-74351